MKRRHTLLAAAAAALVIAPAAAAHVEVTPESAPAGSDAELAFRVPTEKNIPTVKLEIKLPAGLTEVTFQPKSGWTRTATKTTVTWSGGQIKPGEFDEFRMIAHVPSTPGKVLVFPTLQTYSDGSIVRWIGAPTSDTPAPRLTLEAAASAVPPTASDTTPTTTTVTKSSDSKGRANLALGFGIAGVILALAALGVAAARRRRA